MKTQIGRRQMLKRAGLLGTAGALATIPSAAFAAGNDQNDQQEGKTIVGAWIDTITSPGDPPFVFQSLSTFDSGGGLTATASIDNSPGFKSGPTHGAWVHTGGRSYRWFAHAFSMDDSGPTNGTYRIRSRTTLSESGDEYTAAGTFDIYDPKTGAIVVPEAPFTAVGKRIKA